MHKLWLSTRLKIMFSWVLAFVAAWFFGVHGEMKLRQTPRYVRQQAKMRIRKSLTHLGWSLNGTTRNRLISGDVLGLSRVGLSYSRGCRS